MCIFPSICVYLHCQCACCTREAQLNDAEYAGPLIAALLFLELKGVAAPVGATLVAFGAVAYFWGQVLTRNRLAQPLGGGPRYVGMGCLTYALYGTVF